MKAKNHGKIASLVKYQLPKGDAPKANETVGEEGGGTVRKPPVTTMATGEEGGGPVTTMAVGEEGGSAR